MKKRRYLKRALAGRAAKAGESSPLANFRGFKQGLFEPVDALPLGVFRFLFGLLLALEFFFVSRETFPADYIQPLFHFTYPLFDLLGLKPLPESYLWLLFHVMQISTIGIMLGLFTRVSLVIFTALFGYFFFMESSVYTNHYYLIFLLSFLLCLGHSGAILSCDSFLRAKVHREEVCYWELFLLRFQICAVFLFGGLAKLNSDWLIYAAPLYLNLIKHFTFLGYPLQAKWIAILLAWGGMLSDLALGVLLVINRWHKPVFVWLCLFNGANIIFFGWGIKTFPYMMVASYILFVPSSSVRRFMSRFGEWIPPKLLSKA